eukprot:1195630-Prorocentrum_minimum.AAC.1
MRRQVPSSEVEERLSWCERSWIFRLNSRLRQLMYSLGLFQVHRLPIPIISVGNVTWGGSGKTPMVEYIAHRCLQFGATPLILSRSVTLFVSSAADLTHCPPSQGYAGGDEVKMMMEHFRNTHVQFGVGADRVSVAKQMLQCGQAPGDIISGTTAHSAAPQVAILDDGLQYLSLHRDLEVDPLSISDSTAQAVISTAQAVNYTAQAVNSTTQAVKSTAQAVNSVIVATQSISVYLPAFRFPQVARTLRTHHHHALRTRFDGLRKTVPFVPRWRPWFPWTRVRASHGQWRGSQVVMVNAVTGWGSECIIPRGPLRERPSEALRRADIVILHHAHLVGGYIYSTPGKGFWGVECILAVIGTGGP